MPIQRPRDPRLQQRLYAAAQSYMTPRQMQEHDEEAAKYVKEELEREVDEVLKNGIAIFGKGTPEQRWQSWLTNTDLRDVPTLLAEDAFIKIKAGVLPPLHDVPGPNGTISRVWTQAFNAGEDFFESFRNMFLIDWRRVVGRELDGNTQRPVQAETAGESQRRQGVPALPAARSTY